MQTSQKKLDCLQTHPSFYEKYSDFYSTLRSVYAGYGAKGGFIWGDGKQRIAGD
jgi:hypothetical protein